MAAEATQIPQACLTVRVGWQKKLTKRDISLNLTSEELQQTLQCISAHPRQPALMPCSDETIPAVLECLLDTVQHVLPPGMSAQYWPNRGACYFILPGGASVSAQADALIATAHGAAISSAEGRLFSSRLHEGLKEQAEPTKPPSVDSGYTPPIQGLCIIRNFLPPPQEAALLESISASRAGNSGVLSRRVVHYGYAFDYARRAVDWAATPLPIPADISAVAEQLLQEDALPPGTILDQSTVNDYAPGQGIAGHLDNPKVFGPVVISVSMGAPIVMNFERSPPSETQACPPVDPPSPEEAALPDSVAVLLPPRSAMVLTGRARYAWAHGITKRKTDVVDDKVVSRRNRTSLTFRQVIETADEPVDDTPAVLLSAALQGAQATPPREATEGPQLPPFEGPSAAFEVSIAAAFSSTAAASSAGAATSSTSSTATGTTDPGTTGPDVERSNVHKLYNAIAKHFSGTRHSPWPSVSNFLNSLPERSLVFDLGCGNGKYMVGHITDPPNRVSVIGADISSGLTEICGQRGLNVLTADALCVPFRSGAADASISIAVLHHLSSASRRHAAIVELLRMLRPGGRFMVQAWAQEQDEQSKRRFESQDVMVPWKFRPEYLSAAPAFPGGPRPEHSLASEAAAAADGSVDTEAAAAAEVARVAAAWGGEVDEEGGRVVFQRYCHVYVAGELERLVKAHPQAAVDAVWWERGNWCVTGTKTVQL